MIKSTGTIFDTGTINSGEQVLISQYLDLAFRIPEPFSCASFPTEIIDTMIHTRGKQIVLDYESDENWEITEFEKYLSQTCLLRIDRSFVE